MKVKENVKSSTYIKKFFKENYQGVYLACQTLNHQVMHSFNLSYVSLTGNYLVSAPMMLLLYCQTAISPSSRAHNALSSSHAICLKLQNSQIEENQFQKHQISYLIYTYLKVPREGEESGGRIYSSHSTDATEFRYISCIKFFNSKYIFKN